MNVTVDVMTDRVVLDTNATAAVVVEGRVKNEQLYGRARQGQLAWHLQEESRHISQLYFHCRCRGEDACEQILLFQGESHQVAVVSIRNTGRNGKARQSDAELIG
ncbi:hypothetical protein HPP92_008807 [Vanilla planifolia]|uniref:Uncharacterized protein n=1 Tax=Vanilla planifolia TaxID=51239 RepID=A0A835V609_VANPL|nr:hypothetical protein HPP92_008807 [Vanilla planifolia]